MRLSRTRIQPSAKLQLPPGRDPHATLIEAFAGVIAFAEAQHALAAEDPVRAVHQARKSLRRARTMLRLLRPTLDDAVWRGLHGRLRAAMEPTSALRDGDVLGDTLALLTDETDDRKLARSADKALALLEAQRAGAADRSAAAPAKAAATVDKHSSDGPAPHAVARAQHILQVAVHDAAQVAEELHRALPADVAPRAPHRGLRERYKAARRALDGVARPDAVVLACLDPVHDVRKRIKELRYGLELLVDEPGISTGARAARRQAHKEAATLSTDYGALADLGALDVWLDGPGAALKGKHKRRLRAAADARVQATAARTVRRTARGLLADKPKQWARALDL